jgi:hypothetical protein
MAQGILGKADLAAATPTLICTIAQTLETINVNFCNRNPTDSAVKLWIGTGGSPVASDAMLFSAPISGNGNIEFTGIPTSLGEKVWAESNTTLVTVCVRGL